MGKTGKWVILRTLPGSGEAWYWTHPRGWTDQGIDHAARYESSEEAVRVVRTILVNAPHLTVEVVKDTVVREPMVRMDHVSAEAERAHVDAIVDAASEAVVREVEERLANPPQQTESEVIAYLERRIEVVIGQRDRMDEKLREAHAELARTTARVKLLEARIDFVVQVVRGK